MNEIDKAIKKFKETRKYKFPLKVYTGTGEEITILNQQELTAFEYAISRERQENV